MNIFTILTFGGSSPKVVDDIC